MVTAWALVGLLALASAAFFSPEHAFGCRPASAQSTPFTPSSYCWYFDTEITNNSGSDVTDGMFRIEVNNAGLVANNQLDPLAWTVYSQSGSFSNPVATEIQDLDQVDGAWWLEMPGTLANGETRTLTTYFKNAEQQRDQGINFTGREYIEGPDNSDTDLSISTEFNIIVTMINTDETARDEILVSKRTATPSGYALGFRDNGGVLEIWWRVNNAGICAYPWQSAWTGQPIRFNVNYDAAIGVDTEFYLNDNIGTPGMWFWACNTGSNVTPVGTTQLFTIGAESNDKSGKLSGTFISDVTVYNTQVKNNPPILHYQFNAEAMTEVLELEPTYTGTTLDSTANSYDATYTFVRPQTGFVVNNGEPALVSGGQRAPVPSTVFDVAGSPIDGNVFINNENTRLPFYGWLSPIVGDMRMSREAAWALILFLPSLLLGMATVLLFPQALAVVGMMGLPYAYGVAGGLIEPWWILVLGIAMLVTYGIKKWERQS